MRIKFLIILSFLIPLAFAGFPVEKDSSINTQQLANYDQFYTDNPLIINNDKNKFIGTKKDIPFPMLIKDGAGTTIYKGPGSS